MSDVLVARVPFRQRVATERVQLEWWSTENCVQTARFNAPRTGYGY